MIMKLFKAICMAGVVVLNVSAQAAVSAAESFTDALTSGKPYVDLRLRYETVDQNNALQDADALTLRTKLGYATDQYHGFSATIELEDSRSVFGVDDYSLPPTGFKTGQFSVIADPETTELDQGFIQYKSSGFTGILGRQIITLDNHRFVGHVGWRQDRQSFDGLTLKYQPNDQWGLQISQLTKRNRIFAEDADLDSNDTLVNVNFQTGLGKLTAYAYLLELDDVGPNSNDTFGVRFAGSTKAANTKVSYVAEFATQETNDVIDTDYFVLEAGAEFAAISAKIGLESLGSDNGIGAFSTPLATLHKFNGWADQFLGTPVQGLEDIYLSLAGKLAKGKWSISYHDFSSDVSAADGSDDLGDEIDVVYSRNFGDHYYAGIKYADYSAGSTSFSKVDTGKLWLWGGVKF